MVIMQLQLCIWADSEARETKILEKFGHCIFSFVSFHKDMRMISECVSFEFSCNSDSFIIFLGFSVIRHKKQYSGKSMDNTFFHLWSLLMYSDDFGVDVLGDFMFFQ